VSSQTEQQLIQEDVHAKNETGKGKIPLILLHEVIKYESNLPNRIYIQPNVSDELKKPLEVLHNIR
jgi:hypothetical protein